MKRPIIAVDADDTLFDENEAVRLFHNRTYGTTHTAEDYRIEGEFHDYFESVWKTDAEEAGRRYENFIAWKLANNLPPLPGASTTLKFLKQTYELVVVTMRDERSVAMTHQALSEHYSDIFSDVHFVGLWGAGDKVTKAMICQEIGAGYLIDDGFHHCELAAASGVEGLLFGEYGWSRTKQLRPHMTRVKNWAAVRKYFDARQD